MFYKFDEIDKNRLNRGVRGRLIDHCRYLLQENKMEGFEAFQIYENTQRLEYVNPNFYSSVIDMTDEGDKNGGGVKLKTNKKFVHHDLHVQVRSYLEKKKYFN
jgi:hypothetical protein